jgi:hypothetical protein
MTTTLCCLAALMLMSPGQPGQRLQPQQQRPQQQAQHAQQTQAQQEPRAAQPPQQSQEPQQPTQRHYQQSEQPQASDGVPQPALPPTRICVAVTTDVQSGIYHTETFEEEVTRIWMPYGVEIDGLSGPCRAARVGPAIQVRLRERLSPARPRTMPANALGSINFIGGRPAPTIDLWIDEAARMLGGTASYLTATSADPRFRVQLARLLGRSLAHELGHYLLGTQQHSAEGLMRAHYIQGDAIKSDPSMFSLDASQIDALHRTLALWRAEITSDTGGL